MSDNSSWARADAVAGRMRDHEGDSEQLERSLVFQRFGGAGSPSCGLAAVHDATYSIQGYPPSGWVPNGMSIH